MTNRVLIVKELPSAIVLKLKLTHEGRTSVSEIARFSQRGLGYVALGAAGRALIDGMGFVDSVEFHGQPDTYRMLAGLGIIQVMSRPEAA